ncbi:MAG: hypothetical protein HQ561_11015 [Desulfobacteraceae bacterium]|nr:hypothetical protein [Desulfobacteraceae bacterium]
MGEGLFQAILDHPERLWLGKADTSRNLESLATKNGRINLDVPLMGGG